MDGSAFRIRWRRKEKDMEIRICLSLAGGDYVLKGKDGRSSMLPVTSKNEVKKIGKKDPDSKEGA